MKFKKYYTESMMKGISYIQYKDGRLDNLLHTRPGPWGSQISIESANEGGKVVSPSYQPPLHLRKYSGNSFLLEAESIPGPYCDRKDYGNKYSSDITGNQTRDLQACSAVPQPTAPPRDSIML